MDINGLFAWRRPLSGWARGGEFGVEFLVMRPPQLQRIQQFVIKHRPVA